MILNIHYQLMHEDGCLRKRKQADVRQACGNAKMDGQLIHTVITCNVLRVDGRIILSLYLEVEMMIEAGRRVVIFRRDQVTFDLIVIGFE